ncbi:hypothetical protein GCM10009122_57550 [Fulvivirga kasyanovii]|uniref:Uncharacterized protein n=1 Tax=Fulvivirga kasyanovii TaxID=396812 RepID=A0ABW9RIP9_9BACT|nr:pinensin family lanthipeptide [Fulvivirga kasyanovii]MTI23933.1 hypothetical protein [Fulvivirga kasyanovii]
MKRKLNLRNLEVKSFVTSLDSHASHTIAGGLANIGGGLDVDKVTLYIGCQSNWQGPCQPSEYMTACQTGHTDCYADKDPDEISGL